MKYVFPLLLLVAGCGSGLSVNTSRASSGNEGSDGSAPVGNMKPTFDKAKAEQKLAKAPELGKTQSAAKLTATLTTDPAALRVGEAKFVADVRRDGKPLKDATVIVDLTMPLMNMGGPRILLSPEAPGRYAGLGSMPMAGSYLGILRVTPEGAKESTFEFKFEAQP